MYTGENQPESVGLQYQICLKEIVICSISQLLSMEKCVHPFVHCAWWVGWILSLQETFALSENISTSIFYDASLATATDTKNLHMLNPGGSITAHLLSATSCVTGEGEAMFALGTNAGSILLLKMPPVGITGEESGGQIVHQLWELLIHVGVTCVHIVTLGTNGGGSGGWLDIRWGVRGCIISLATRARQNVNDQF